MSEEDPKRWDLTTKVKALVCCCCCSLMLKRLSFSLVSLSSSLSFSAREYHHPLTFFSLLFSSSRSSRCVITHYNYEQIGEYLDRHLSYPMIEFIESKNLFDSAEVSRAKMELLSKTRMVDLAGDLYKQINNASDIPEEMKQKRTEVISSLKSVSDTCSKLLAFLKEHGKTLSKSDKRANKSLLKEQHSVGEEEIEGLFQYAKYQFDCGKYEISAELLGQYRLLSEDQGKLRAALWGKLASDCLLQNWEHAMEDLTRLREAIDNGHFKTSLEQMRNRCWLCHWSLFVFFNHQEHQPHGGGILGLCDMFFQERYMQAIQYEAPHLLRYCACAVIMSKRRRGMIKDISRIMQVEPYRDPMLEFFDQLFVKFDFDAAQKALENCEAMMRNDFFLSKFVDEFKEHARMHIFETYCRVQKTIKIEELAKKLNLDTEAAEKWIVNLIRTSKLRAKIDMDQGVVTMMTETHTPHDQLIERTKGMLSKTYQLAHAVASGAHLGEGTGSGGGGGGGYHHHHHHHHHHHQRDRDHNRDRDRDHSNYSSSSQYRRY